jgi:hypothetical protein
MNCQISSARSAAIFDFVIGYTSGTSGIFVSLDGFFARPLGYGAEQHDISK